MTDPEVGSVGDKARRRSVLIVGLSAATVVAIVGGTWAVAAAFESPEQRAASATPPSPGPLLAEVGSGSLERKVSTRGTLALEREQFVPVGIGTTDGEGGGVNVVTKTIPVGTSLTAGNVVLEVNGRPRLATTGSFRYYRDLGPGMSGSDVRQLQAFLGVPTDGVFGRSTETAVRKLYRAVGYSPGQSAPPAPSESGTKNVESTPGDPADAAPPPPTILVAMAELLVFERFPSYVVSVPPVGDLPADAKLVVESGGFVARADVPLSFAHQMKAQLPVSIDHQGTVLNGTVLSVGEAPGMATTTGGPDEPADAKSGSDQKRVHFALAPDAPIDFSWRGREVVVSAVLATAATDALIVPSIAVITERGAKAHVRKQTTGGGFVDVPVEEVATLDGKSAIAPVKKESLAPGDKVRTG